MQRCLPQHVSPMEVPRVPLLQGIEKEKGYTGYTLLPTDLVTEVDLLCTETEGPGAHGRERVGTEPPQSYKVALWATHQKACGGHRGPPCNDLERLEDKHEGHESIARIEVTTGPGLEVAIGPSLEVTAGPSLEVVTGPSQEVAQGSSQGTRSSDLFERSSKNSQ